MNNSNINARLLRAYLKRADITQQMEPMEGGGGSSDAESAAMTPEQWAAQAMGMSEQQFAGHNPKGIEARQNQRAQEQAARDQMFAKNRMGIRTQEQADFNDPAAIAKRMQTRPIGPNGLPIPTYRDMERENSLVGNAMTAQMQQMVNQIFEDAAANNTADYERARELAAELAANDAATTMGVRFPRNTEELKAEALGLFDTAEVNQNIDDELLATNRGGDVTGEVRFMPTWRSELRALLQEGKEETEARTMGDEAVSRFRESQTNAAKPEAKTKTTPAGNNQQAAKTTPAGNNQQAAKTTPAGNNQQAAKPEANYLANIFNPTGNQVADYGIYGGLGALLGGGLGGLFSDKKNRLRNALLFALLGGGLGLGGKYLADRYSGA